MTELQLVFEGPGGEVLLAWCVEKGHLNANVESPVDVAEHNLVMSLLHEAGISMMPIIPRFPKKKPVKTEQNLIDSTLKE